MADEPNKNVIPGWLQRIAIGRNPKHTLLRLITVIVLGAVAVLFFSFVYLPIKISGPSMYPTYQDGQINFINRFAYFKTEPKRGDVIAIRFSSKHIMYVKRIVGMPGESLRFTNGRIYINDKLLDEPYVYLPSSDWNSEPRMLGPQEYYVVGDNRSMPFENHDKGGAERKRILGKIVLHSKVNEMAVRD